MRRDNVVKSISVINLLFISLSAFLFFSLSSFAQEPIRLPGSPNVWLKERPLPPRYDQCHLCHIKKQKYFEFQKFATEREHKRVEVVHGNVILSCHSCHDMNRNNYLLSPKSPQTSFSNTSPVCKRCHAAIYRDWTEGIHGHRIGGWRGEKIQFHCIDCHNPHSVRFKPMNAVDVPGATSGGAE